MPTRIPRSPRRASRAQPRPTLTRPQYAIYSAGWTPEGRFRAAVCGRRFGKSFLAVEERDGAQGVVREMLSRGYPSAVVNKVLELLGGGEEASA